MHKQFHKIFNLSFYVLFLLGLLANCINNPNKSDEKLNSHNQKEIKRIEQKINFGHSSGIEKVAVSPNGKFVLTSAIDRKIILWEVATGKEILTIESYNRVISELIFTPDSKSFYAGYQNGRVIKWDISLGKELWSAEASSLTGTKVYGNIIKGDNKFSEFIKQPGGIDKFAVSSDQKYLLSGGKLLVLRNSSSGKRIKTLTDHSSEINNRNIPYPVTSIAIAPNNLFALSGAEDGSIILWELPSGKKLKFLSRSSWKASSWKSSVILRLSYHDYNQKDMLFLIDKYNKKTLSTFETNDLYRTGLKIYSQDKRYYFENIGGGAVRLVDIKKKDEQLIELKWGGQNKKLLFQSPVVVPTWGIHSITATAISPDNRYALTASNSGNLRLWVLKSGENAVLSYNPDRIVLSICFQEEGNIAKIYYRDGKIDYFDVHNKSIKEKQINLHNAERLVYVSPNGKYGIIVSENGDFYLWNLLSLKKVKSFKNGSGNIIKSVSISPDGLYGIMGTKSGKLYMWDLENVEKVRTLQGHNKDIKYIGFLSDSNQIISSAFDNKIILWDIYQGKEMVSNNIQNDFKEAFQVIPKTNVLLFGNNGNIGLWDFHENKFLGAKENINNDKIVSISQGGKIGIAISKNGKIKIVDLLNSRVKTEIEPELPWISLAGFSNNDELIFTSHLNIIIIRNVDSGLPLLTIKNSSNFTIVCISPDNKYILAGSDDNSMSLWDIKSGLKIREFYGHSGRINSVAFSPNGKQILSGSDDMTARIWDIFTGEEIIKMFSSDDGEWGAATPDGYYHTSPEGSNLIHWVFPERVETYPFSLFENVFKRPDIIRNRIKGYYEAGKPTPKINPPPKIETEEHLTFKEISTEEYTFEVNLLSTPMIKTLRVFVNGRPTLAKSIHDYRNVEQLTIPLNNGANRITIIAYDENGLSSNPKYFDIFCKNEVNKKPNLYFLGVGVSDYPNMPQKWQLDYAHTDAKRLLNAFYNQEAKMFNKVYGSIIINQSVSLEAVEKEFSSLKNIDKNDIVIIYFAGHGVKDKDGIFYFLTSEANLVGPSISGITWPKLSDYLSMINGRSILLLDACHSGDIVSETIIPNDELARDLFIGKRGGTIVFSASKGRQFSFESPDIGEGAGVFTYAITQGLGSKSNLVDLNDNGYVEFMELVDYVKNYVDQETKGEQTPWLSRKELFGDLPIAIVSN